MKNSCLIILILMFTGCIKKDDINISLNIGCEEECGEWERCSNVSNSWSYDWQCTPLLGLYTNHGHWSGELNINDDLGNSYFQEILNLDALCADPSFYFNSSVWKYIMLPYPISEYSFYSNNGFYPDSDLNWIDLEFTNPVTLEFIINDSIYDPFVESVVFYQGGGQIKNTNGSASAILEFNCNYFFNNSTYSVNFSATR